jgi:hypothetical protein
MKIRAMATIAVLAGVAAQAKSPSRLDDAQLDDAQLN